MSMDIKELSELSNEQLMDALALAHSSVADTETRIENFAGDAVELRKLINQRGWRSKEYWRIRGEVMRRLEGGVR